MALDFNSKLNRIGVGGNFGAKKAGNGASAQAKKNLGTYSSASSSSNYSLSGKRAPNFVAGQHVSKGSNKYNYNGLRSSLNGRSYSPAYVSSGHGTYAQGGMYGVQGDDKFMNFMRDFSVGAEIGFKTLTALDKLGVLGGSKGVSSTGGSAPATNSAAIDGAMAALSGSGGGTGTGTGVSGLINKMSSASDSVTLRGSLSDSMNELSNMKGMTNIYESAAQNAEKAEGTLKQNVSTAKDNLKDADGVLDKAKTTVRGKQAGRDNALNKLAKVDADYAEKERVLAEKHDAAQTAKSNYSTAQQATSRAQTAYNDAEAKLGTIDRYITDANGNQVENPAYRQALQARDQAKANLDEAKVQEDRARTAKESAEQAETQAETARQQAYDNLGDAKATVDEAKKELTEAQKGVDEAIDQQGKAKDAQNQATEKYNEANSILESNQSAITQFKNHKSNLSKLEKAVESEKKRLEKMEKDEQKHYDKYDRKAQKGIDKNDTRSDKMFSGTLGKNKDGGNDAAVVDTKKEARLNSKMEKTNDKTKQNIAKRNAYESSVDERAFINNAIKNNTADFTLSGSGYRQITTPSGQTLYYKGDDMISQVDYERDKKAAGF